MVAAILLAKVLGALVGIIAVQFSIEETLPGFTMVSDGAGVEVVTLPFRRLVDAESVPTAEIEGTGVAVFAIEIIETLYAKPRGRCALESSGAISID